MNEKLHFIPINNAFLKLLIHCLLPEYNMKISKMRNTLSILRFRFYLTLKIIVFTSNLINIM